VRVRPLLIPALWLLASGFAAASTDYVYRPVSISVFPLLSTNGRDATNINSSFSLNIIGGYLGRLAGVELGSVFNIELDDARGYQVAGGINVVSGSFHGVQQAGAVNIVGHDLYVLQQSGAFSMAVGNVYGCQMAGGACIAMAGLAGAQLAGGANVCAGFAAGLQVAGGANVSRDFTGAQVAGGANLVNGRADGLQLAGGVNFCREFRGAQIAPVNITEEGRGLQLGVVNVADHIDVPVGIVNIIRTGQFHIDAWTSEAAMVNVGLKTGSRYVYSVVSFGLHPTGDTSLLLAGLGLGGHIPLNRFFVDVDAITSNVYPWPHWFWTDTADGYRFLTTLRVTGGWQVTDRVAVIAGPTANLWLSDTGNSWDLPMYGLPRGGFYARHFAVWPGFTAGLQLL
jgi:hypothetical protein